MLVPGIDNCRFAFSMPIHQYYLIPNTWPWCSWSHTSRQ